MAIARSAPNQPDCDQRLRQVDPEGQIGCGDLTTGRVEQPYVAVVADQNGSSGQPTMGDLALVQPLQLLDKS